MSSTPTHRPPSKAPPLPTAKATGSKTRRDGKTAKAPPGASDRGHSLDDANTVRRAKTPGTVRVGSAARHAVRAAKALRAPAAAPTPNNAAVVKVLGYRHSAGETVATMKYIRDKDGPTEDDWAQDVTKDHIALTEEWGLRDDDGRQTVHLMFSLPNTNPAAEWDAARDTIRELFPNRPYICTLHTDTDHPHVHVIARMRDYDGRKLRIDRETLHRYRETLTRHGRARGIDVEARRYAVPTRQRRLAPWSLVRANHPGVCCDQPVSEIACRHVLHCDHAGRPREAATSFTSRVR